MHVLIVQTFSKSMDTDTRSDSSDLLQIKNTNVHNKIL